MRTLALFSILTCILCFQVSAEDVRSTEALKRFLAIKDPSSQRVLSDIYHSMLEIDQNIESDPNYDISVIVKWRDKVEEILKTDKMKPFLLEAQLNKTDAQDYDMLARSLWFPDDFLFTQEDRKLLALLKATAAKPDKRTNKSK